MEMTSENWCNCTGLCAPLHRHCSRARSAPAACPLNRRPALGTDGLPSAPAAVPSAPARCRPGHTAPLCTASFALCTASGDRSSSASSENLRGEKTRAVSSLSRQSRRRPPSRARSGPRPASFLRRGRSSLARCALFRTPHHCTAPLHRWTLVRSGAMEAGAMHAGSVTAMRELLSVTHSSGACSFRRRAGPAKDDGSFRVPIRSRVTTRLRLGC